MSAILKFLKGKKTYLIGGAAAIAGGALVVIGQPLIGGQLLATGLGLCGLRAGLSTEILKLLEALGKK